MPENGIAFPAGFWHTATMTWKNKLTPQETSELGRAEGKRDDARDAYNAVRRKLKARAESRMRQAEKLADADD